MTQPMDRMCRIPAQGAIDEEAGEFWFENPFEIIRNQENLSAFERNKFYLNQSGQRFVDLSSQSGADIDSDSRSVIVADFNRDGAPDLLVASVGGGAIRLFLNRIRAGTRRLVLQLEGVHSNRPAIGARVIAHCGERRIFRHLFAQNGFMGQSPPELNLGVGNAKQVDRLELYWPSGRVQEFENLPVDRVLKIVEGQEQIDSMTGLKGSNKSHRNDNT